MSPRWANRRDENEPAIIEALLAAGYAVKQLDGVGVLDLLVSWDGWTALLEVKGGRGPLGGTSGRELTRQQEQFVALWKGEWVIVRDPVEALEWCDVQSGRCRGRTWLEAES